MNNTYPNIEMTLTFSTNYNGVALTIDDDDIEVTSDMYTVLDDVSDTFPEYTGDWADNWEHSLTTEQEKKLCEMAVDRIAHMFPNATVTFEYDNTST